MAGLHRASFTSGFADGSLAEAAFRYYLAQDYLFLIEFARAYALSKDGNSLAFRYFVSSRSSVAAISKQGSR